MTTAVLAAPLAGPAIDMAVMTSAEDEAAWTGYIERHPQATGYHAWPWRRVFKNAFGHDAVYLAVRDGQQVKGVLPLVYVRSAIFGRSLTSMAFLNYGGILADTPEVAQRLVDAARNEAARLDCPHVELRHIEQQFPDLPCRQHKVTMVLTLGPGLWERLDRKVRNQVRKAQKSGLSVSAGGRELVPEFYRVFARNMRDLGTPVYARALFEQVLEQFPGRAAIHVVRLAGRPVAAGLTFRTGARIEVPWASSIREFNSLCPNHMLYWDIIDAAAQAGCTLMDFGRSTPNEGTFKFKEQWGASPVPLHWEYVVRAGQTLPAIAAGNPKFRLMVEAWKRLPLPVATMLGPAIVRGIP